MSNSSDSIMTSIYLDLMIEYDEPVGDLPTPTHGALQGSMFNPVQAMRLLTVGRSGVYSSEELAKATGAPAEWFSGGDVIDAPIDDVLPVLGKMALLYLSNLRNCALQSEAGFREDTLSAVETATAALDMNRIMTRKLTQCSARASAGKRAPRKVKTEAKVLVMTKKAEAGPRLAVAN